VAEDWKDRRARRVVVGTDRAGKAVMESDEVTPTQRSSSGFNISDIWVVQTLPANVRDGAPTDMADTIPREGILIRVVTFQPDGEGDIHPASDRGAVEPEDLKATARDSGVEIAGLHMTDSVDVGTVISGELTLLLPTGETTLRPGETFVLRGSEHAWRNRTAQPVTIVVTMIGAR
jgi:hypothetical protein